MLARFTGSFSGFMLPCIYTLTVSTILSNLISSKAFDRYSIRDTRPTLSAVIQRYKKLAEKLMLLLSDSKLISTSKYLLKY